MNLSIIKKYCDNYRSIKNKSFIVAGDYCLDKYIYSDIRLDQKFDYSDLSTYCVFDEKVYPGGAGNVAKYLLTMGAKVICVGLIGNDGNGYDLKKSLESYGADVKNLHIFEQRITNTYYRPVRKSEEMNINMNEWLLINNKITDTVQEKEIINSFEQAMGYTDGVVVVEQFRNEAYGNITHNIRNYINQIASRYQGKYFIVDSRDNIYKYRNVFVKCNQYEFAYQLQNVYGVKCDVFDEDAFNKINNVINLSLNRGIYVTLGDRGMIYRSGVVTCLSDAIYSAEEIDTCGAGDAASVGIITALCTGFSETEAMVIGNLCAHVTIKQIGVTGIITYENLMQAYEEMVEAEGDKII